MSDQSHLLKTRPSHFTNLAYYLVLTIIFVGLWIVKEPIGEASLWLSQAINEAFLQKGSDFSMLMAKIVSNVVLMTPVYFGAYRYIKTEFNLHYFYEDRLVFFYGLVNRHKDNIEYYRIKDFYTTSPIYLRVFGLSIFHIISTDRRFPHLVLRGCRGVSEFENELRTYIEASKADGKGREVDVV